jgi:hypothetical protein
MAMLDTGCLMLDAGYSMIVARDLWGIGLDKKFG